MKKHFFYIIIIIILIIFICVNREKNTTDIQKKIKIEETEIKKINKDLKILEGKKIEKNYFDDYSDSELDDFIIRKCSR
jgi:uncharacterized membrane protein